MADVAAVLHQVPVNRLHEVVGLMLRGGDRVAEAHGTEHAPAGGDDLRALRARAGVKYLAGQARGGVESADGIAFAVFIGVAAGGHHHAERGARIPARVGAVERAGERGFA